MLLFYTEKNGDLEFTSSKILGFWNHDKCLFFQFYLPNFFLDGAPFNLILYLIPATLSHEWVESSELFHLCSLLGVSLAYTILLHHLVDLGNRGSVFSLPRMLPAS